MAETKTKIITNSPSPKRKNKLVITGGVGGIAGVLIIGGVIGIVSLIRKRAAKKQSMKAKASSESPPTMEEIKNSEQNDHGGHLLRSIADEEKPVLMAEKEISNTSCQEDEKKESIWKSDIIEIIKDRDGNGKVEYAPSDEIPPIIIGDKNLLGKETEATGIISEENSPMPLEGDIHFVYEDDEGEEDEETEREGSEGTGDSSMESNSEAIWPVESIQVLTKDGVPIKEIKKDEPEIGILKENGDLQFLNHQNGDLQSLNHPPSAKEFISRPTFIVWIVLVMAILYHFFEHYLPVVLSSK